MEQLVSVTTGKVGVREARTLTRGAGCAYEHDDIVAYEGWVTRLPVRKGLASLIAVVRC